MWKKLNEKVEPGEAYSWQTPPLIDLLRRPRQFFAALSDLPENPYRYVHFRYLIPLAVIMGGFGFLSNKPVREAMQGSGGPLPLPLAGMALLMALTWLFTWALHWKIMGWILGKEARTGEVYGVSLLASVLPNLVFVPLVLIPVTLQTPPPDLSGLQGTELRETLAQFSQDLYRELRQTPLRRALTVLWLLTGIWSYYLAYLGVLSMTGDRRKALLGSILPALVNVPLYLV